MTVAESLLAPSLPELPHPETDRDLGTVAREFVKEAREGLETYHHAGASGAWGVDWWTGAIDRLVCFLYDAAGIRFGLRNVRLDQRCAILAQGGYGRGELNPHSDLDLLVLHPGRVGPFVETVTETILYALWDARMGVGHAVRSIRDCVRLMDDDFKIRTALLDLRPLVGDQELSTEGRRVLAQEIGTRGVPRFLREKLAESEARNAAFGDSVYLLEPEVKEGAGGLRDLHTALWISKVKFKVSGFAELPGKGIITPGDLEEILAARDFLLRVRTSMHLLAAGHQDRLTFDLQDAVADDLGYRVDLEKNLSATDLLLRDYYLMASVVGRLSRAVIARAVEPSRSYRIIGRLRSRTIRPGVRIESGELQLIDSGSLAEDPLEILRIFSDCQRHGVRLASALEEKVRESASGIGDVQRAEGELNGLFLDILRYPRRVWVTLAEMHRLGVLSRILPEWEHLRCLVLRDVFHVYTVDQHSLRLIREFESLRDGEHSIELPLLTQVAREVERPELLCLAMMLHDVGKGLGGGHSEKGAEMARHIGERLGFDPDGLAELQFLVREHLTLAHLAEHRDFQDEKLAIELARLVGGPEALRRLFLLTYADMRATGPKMWSAWKDMLLGEAYVRVQEVFQRGFEPEDRAGRIQRLGERLRERLSRPAPGAVGGVGLRQMEEFIAAMPPAYVLAASDDDLIADAELMQRAQRDGLATRIVHQPEREHSTFTVVTSDRPGLFATLTGVIAACGMNVLSARITTSQGDWAVDTFRISLPGGGKAPDEDRWQRLFDLTEAVLSSRRSLADVLPRTRGPSVLDRRPARAAVTDVLLDEASSDEFLVVEVYAPDQVGLLHRIADALFKLGLEIHQAKISTTINQVLDVFYVTETSGRKSTRGAEIRSRVLEALQFPPGDDARGESGKPVASGTVSGSASGGI